MEIDVHQEAGAAIRDANGPDVLLPADKAFLSFRSVENDQPAVIGDRAIHDLAEAQKKLVGLGMLLDDVVGALDRHHEALDLFPLDIAPVLLARVLDAPIVEHEEDVMPAVDIVEMEHPATRLV
jgi:hypothetical protein